MEDLLDVYMQPYDEGSPVVCIDERPCQLVGHVQPPIPAQPGHPAREDTEFSRNGACSTFLMFEPQVGWRHARVKETRTKRDFAECLKYLLDEKYAHVPKIRLVLDNLNTTHLQRCTKHLSLKKHFAWQRELNGITLHSMGVG